ncbi:MAG: peptidoglycan DD-metalloendopeptidase family protein [Spirosomaceae bacterium]|nr:peptidoglycan DD-metalloendopeptidase family protein [Spirosomataceae bacterium]
MIHKITPFDFSKADHLWLDFTAANQKLKSVDLRNTEAFSDYVFNIIKSEGKKCGVGGYLENRAVYHRSEHFKGTEQPRTIHLGLDIWAEAFTPIFAPADSIVHSFHDNKGFGDYGPTIILEHTDYQELSIPKYSLYGHLSRRSLDNLFVGKEINKGGQFAEFGPFPENGDWPPHLHFQLMNDLLGKTGDFPGVCSEADKDLYAEICPNPYEFVGLN